MKRAILVALLLVCAVAAHAQSPLVVTTTSCPVLTLGVPWQCQFNATGGTPPYHWTVIWNSGYLPGLTMNDSTGLLSGTVMQCSNNYPTNCLQQPPFGANVTIDGVTVPLLAAPLKNAPVEKKKKPKTKT